MLLLKHFIIKRSFTFYILTYLKSWNYNIVPCLNRCELQQNLKLYLLQKVILNMVILAFFVTEG